MELNNDLTDALDPDEMPAWLSKFWNKKTTSML